MLFTWTVFLHEYVTGGGLAGQDLQGWESLAAEGHAMRRALAEDLAQVKGVTVLMSLDDRFPDEPGPWRIFRVAPGTEEARVREMASRSDYGIIIAPECDGILHDRVEWLRGSHRGLHLGCHYRGLITATSKHLFAQELLPKGLSIPPCGQIWPPNVGTSDVEELDRYLVPRDMPLDDRWGTWHREPCGINDIWPDMLRFPIHSRADYPPSDLASITLGFPLVAKPVDGVGTQDTYLIQNRAELDALRTSRVPSPESIRETIALHRDAEDWQQKFGLMPWLGLKRLGVMVIQPYIAGTPMSASFLVDQNGRAHLVGVGEQHVTLETTTISMPAHTRPSASQRTFRLQRFRYEGGTVPAGTPEMAEEARRVVEAIPGLFGWVGVDFIWDEGGRPVILEVNPRLTTSYVGLRQLLPPGELARAWLDTFIKPERLPSYELDRRIHEQAPIRFHCDGRIEQAVAS